MEKLTEIAQYLTHQLVTLKIFHQNLEQRAKGTVGLERQSFFASSVCFKVLNTLLL